MIRQSTFRMWLLVITLVAMLPSVALARCGVERWAVKTGTDPDARLVNPDLSQAKPTRIAAMRSWPAPDVLLPDKRTSPYETTVWVVQAWLTVYKEEDSPRTSDSDYHLVLSDESGNTIIAEIPSPDCVDPGSPFVARIRNARSQFDARFAVTGSSNLPISASR